MKLSLHPPRTDCAFVVLESGDCIGARDEEASLLSPNTVQKRRDEFALGRAAARHALAQFGLAEFGPILRGSGREPLWPEGIVGSITHCARFAIAAVARAETARGVGIDLEDANRVAHEEVAPVIGSAAERRWMFGAGDGPRRAAMLFSAKESIYKALYPLAHRFFDFQAVELTWSSDTERFVGRLRLSLTDDFREGYPIEGGCQLLENFVFTHVFLPPS